ILPPLYFHELFLPHDGMHWQVCTFHSSSSTAFCLVHQVARRSHDHSHETRQLRGVRYFQRRSCSVGNFLLTLEGTQYCMNYVQR
ncbi:reverse transcriptase (RNA-dependent DNA polymerase), partial [Trypanosoma vivax Y486]